MSSNQHGFATAASQTGETNIQISLETRPGDALMPTFTARVPANLFPEQMAIRAIEAHIAKTHNGVHAKLLTDLLAAQTVFVDETPLRVAETPALQDFIKTATAPAAPSREPTPIRN